MPAGSADDEEAWLDDEDVATQLNAYAAVRRGHHLVMPFTGERFSISGFTMTDMDYLSRQDIVFLSQLGFPSYSTGNVAEFQEQNSGMHTISHSCMTAESLTQRLLDHRIKEIVDVRSNPVSARYPHFCRETDLFRYNGIPYVRSLSWGTALKGALKHCLRQRTLSPPCRELIISRVDDEYHRVAMLCAESIIGSDAIGTGSQRAS